MVQDRTLAARVLDVTIFVVLGVLCVACILPFVHMLAMSLSSRAAVEALKVTLWPVGFHLENYQHVIARAQFTRSLVTSVARVVVGVILQLMVCVLTAYPLSRDNVPMPGRTVYKVLLLFGMMFNGGLIPTFLVYKDLGLLNKFAVLVIPPALSIFHTIIMINFFRGIPREMSEAAEIDGASHMDLLLRVFLPLSLPALMTIGMFSAVQHWNWWFDGIVFMQQRDKWPLQSYVYSVVLLGGTDAEAVWGTIGQVSNLTPRGLAGAMLLFTSLPIFIVYPFIQRYFMQGLTLGSLKE